MRRTAGGLVVLLAVLAATAWFGWPYVAGSRVPIRVGILHSTTGPMAVNEASMIDAEKLAIEEINAAGGLLGRKVEAVIVDGKSDPDVYAREAERLISVEKVSVIFGCYTSAARKSVQAVVERNDHLLVYAVAYEGLEQSPNIIYTGAAPNQQVIPTVNWCRDLLKAKSFYLLGNDFVWARAVNEIIKDQLKAVGATVAGEEYVPMGSTQLDGAVARAVAAKPDVILSTLIGDSNLPFYEKIRKNNKAAAAIPIASFIVAEDELRGLPAHDMVNDYSICNYFESIDRDENRKFIAAFKQFCKDKDRVTSDVIATAYSSVRLWAQAVRDAETDETRLVRSAMLKQSIDAPEGVISIDRDTQHTWRPFFIGKIQGDGRIEIIWTVSKPIRPVPFPFSRDREQWEKFLENLQSGWGGKWQAPAVSAGPRAALDWPGTEAITRFQDRDRLSLSRAALRPDVR
jgi:urea transport system substrate-binding protein